MATGPLGLNGVTALRRAEVALTQGPETVPTQSHSMEVQTVLVTPTRLEPATNLSAQ